MSSNGSVFSETLQGITNTKLEELSKRRSDFESAKSNILSLLENEEDPIQRLHTLSKGVKACYAPKPGKQESAHHATQSRNPALELQLKNLDCFLAQAKYDPSLSTKMLQTWEDSLLRHLDTQSLKYQYASLYAQLVTEWLSTEKASGSADVDVAMAEGFEDVANAMKQDARREWEDTVFGSANVNKDDLEKYLNTLFGARDPDASSTLKALNGIRAKVAKFESEMLADNQFNSANLEWVAEGLLASGLLTEEKRGVLKDFKNNPIILGEVADVLNMRISSLDSWSWGSDVSVEQRRQINGVYNVLMHEDLLQAIFLQYIGVKWSVFLKGALKQFRDNAGAWKSFQKPIPKIDVQRRRYYLGVEGQGQSVQALRERLYRQHYFMAHLMDSVVQRTEGADGEEEAEYVANRPDIQARFRQQKRLPPPPPPPPPTIPLPAARLSAKMVQSMAPQNMAPTLENHNPDDDDPDAKRPMQSKQRLLRLLSTEIAISTKIHGEMTAFHSTFERWNTLLPHETILGVLSFLGISPVWLNFFKKFLKAPLRFLDDDPSTPSRSRTRGTPASHVLSEVFGESILFCLDFAVNQSTDGSTLFRVEDDFWFWSRNHSTAVTAWKSVTEFVKATGTCINYSKTGTMRISRDPGVSLEIDGSLPQGSIRWGFLKLSPQTGKFEIDQEMVEKHIVDLRKQLHDKRKSVISFVQAWNTYAATFFTSNFGQAANCFGQDHVAQMLKTHERIQREVFSPTSSLASSGGSQKPATNIVDYLKNLMQERFGISDIPDAYLFFPVELGGLDLKSPFISILQVHDTVLQDPSKAMEAFFEAEKESYNARKISFERGSVQHASGFDTRWKPEAKEDWDKFMSFSEYVLYREDVSYGFRNELYDVYKELLRIPAEDGVKVGSARVMNGINALSQLQSVTLRGITGNWHLMEPYWKWIAELYGPEVIDRFGGMNIVEPGLLPMGMVSIFRDKRVKWQG
ncbi:hypothetical protein Hte_001977 [Hypoxylon texense]